MECALHWCLLIEDFHPKLHYFKRVENDVASTFSCYPQSSDLSTEVDEIQPDAYPDYNSEVFSIGLDNESLLECQLHHPVLPDDVVIPLDYTLLSSTITGNRIVTTNQQHSSRQISQY
jgi:hypothetical protein